MDDLRPARDSLRLFIELSNVYFSMNPRGIHFQLQGRRGLPAVLPLIVMAILAIGVIALFVFVGLTVAVIGLSVYACAALYYAVRRKLTGIDRSPPLSNQAEPSYRHPAPNQNPDIKVIDVEAVRVDRE